MRVQALCTLASNAFVTLTLAAAAAQKSDFDVVTSNGKITGHLAPGMRNTVEYLGIPYAEPPIGKLRFAAPLPLEGKADYVAADWTPAKPVDFPGFTPQAQGIINAFAGGAGTPQSEDCLTLNIWAPLREKKSSKQKKEEEKQPVLVFFHGGRFSIGNAHSSFYNGSRFAEATGAIIVTLTYRLNIFGFPGAPDKLQNLGLRDQRRAIEWVHQNIAGFGGDPAKVTIFGQSSGGVAADWWTFAYKDEPIVNGIISESGNAFSFPLNGRELQTRNWYNVSASLGCGGEGDTLDCVRTNDWRDVLAAAAKLPAAPGGNPVRSTPAFYPTVDNDTVFSGYASLLEQGNFAKIPQLLGNNDNEQGYYIIPAYSRNITTTPSQRSQFLLESFTCPNAFEARARAAHGVPVWLYRYFGDWPNTRLYPASGAYHGTEMQMLFGNSGDVSGIAPSKEQDELTGVMRRAWVAFARDPRGGLEKVGWPRFQKGEGTVVRLGEGNRAAVEFVRAEVYSWNCSGVVLAGGQ
ncbi:hypothetical protein MBLNU13_g09689t2 [Cladosporium sp. NU13]